MKSKETSPPFQVTPRIMELVSLVSEKIGAVQANHLYKPPTELRKKNRIKTIKFSLEIEGNSLSLEQVTALMDHKRILAPKKDILEVQNAIKVYEQLQEFDPFKRKDFEQAHGMLMKGLVNDAGRFRRGNVGIVKGSKIEHLAPSGAIVNGLMKDLFHYIKNSEDLILIKSCVFHYELEFIHPFTDGNGRMGRLWQTLILMSHYPVFEFLPVEQLIKNQQTEYYKKLAESDKKGHSTPFIEFMLAIILQALEDLLMSQNRTLQAADRIELFRAKVGDELFSRKSYLAYFKNISAPTASRDLKWAFDQELVEKVGAMRLTLYRFL